MDSSCYSTQYLERLSTDELVKLAEKNGMDIPPDLERMFIIEELLYLDRGGIGRTEESGEHTALPKQRNISTIEVLVRDPLWAFVFWEIRGHDQDGDFCLRAIPLKKDGISPDMAGSFTVPVGAHDSAWYLGFPPDGGNYFKVELCVIRGEQYTTIATSRPFKMPRLVESKRDSNGEMQAVYRNPLAHISGVECFSLLRSMDRQLRPRDE